MDLLRRARIGLMVGVASLLAACGGGAGPERAPRIAAAPPTALPAQAASAAVQAIGAHQPACHQHCLAGTAAVGSAFANGTVSITDATGNGACQQGTITTSADGTYTCDLNAGAVAPYFVVVTDPTGNNPPVVSVATTTPGNGLPLVVNATPLTTAILGQLSPDGNPLTLVAAGAVNAQDLASLTAAVVAQLQPVLGAVNAPAGYDPFSTPIVAATASTQGNAADAVLDLVRVTRTAGGAIGLTTVGSTTIVPLGSAQPLAAPAPGAVSLVPAQQAFAAQVAQCFALATSQRVLATDTAVPASQGGPAVTAAAPACTAMAASLSNGAGQAFLHSGYSFGQFFYALLTRDSMTGAAISVPQDMLFLPGDASATPPTPDRAVLNFRFVDDLGNPGSFIVVAANLASAPSPGWWIVGNQELIDVNVRAVIRRIEQRNPAAPASASHFVSGMQPVINALGPGSIRGGQPMTAVRMTGPGLPAAGLVFIAPIATEVNQPYMDLSNVTGTVPPSGRCGTSVTGNCPLFWMQITAGLTGTAASTLAPNPGGLLWLQPGTAVTPGSPARGAVYTFDVFYGGASTPGYTFRKPLVADAVPATQGALAQWNGLGPTSSALLDPTNATYNGILDVPVTLDWTQNPLAEQVGGATMSIDSKGTLATSIAAPPGATSVTFPAYGTPALTPFTRRQILFGYRTLDGTAKSAMYQWN